MAGIVIRTAMDFAHVRRHGCYQQWITRLTRERWRGQEPNWTPGTALTYAEIIRANWVAGCPCCANYILIEPNELFFCPDCLMQGAEGQAALVIWPDQPDAIISALATRPNPITRNWLRHETVNDLLRENSAHERN